MCLRHTDTVGHRIAGARRMVPFFGTPRRDLYQSLKTYDHNGGISYALARGKGAASGFREVASELAFLPYSDLPVDFAPFREVSIPGFCAGQTHEASASRAPQIRRSHFAFSEIDLDITPIMRQLKKQFDTLSDREISDREIMVRLGVSNTRPSGS